MRRPRRWRNRGRESMEDKKKDGITAVKPNCLYNSAGCKFPESCERCGFDKAEAERRSRITLTKGPDGLWRKEVKHG